MPFAGREADNVSRPYLLNGAAVALRASAAGGDDKRLPKRMGVPSGVSARLERDEIGGCAGRGAPPPRGDVR